MASTSGFQHAPASRVAVVTVLYRSAPNLPAFAASLSAQTHIDWTLVAVDCASPDNSAALVRQLIPEAVVIPAGDNLGFTGGTNIGLTWALEQGFDQLLITNNDLTFEAGFLEALLSGATDHVCTAPVVYLQGTDSLDDTAGGFDWRFATWSPCLYGKPAPAAFSRREEVEMASLTCLLLPAGAVRETGLMDDRFWIYYEDFDYVRRLQAAGYRVLREPSAVAWHNKSASSGGVENPFMVYYATRNRLLLMRLHTPLILFARFFAWFAATRLIRTMQYLREGKTRQTKAMWLGVAHFVQGRLGRTVLPGA